MLTFLVRRVLSLIPILLLVTFGVFMLISLVPGDPAVTIASVGGNPNPETVERLREELHLSDPTIVRYFRWLSDAVRFDFGDSYTTSRPVIDDITSRFPVTASVAVAAITVGIVVGLPLGLVSGMRPGGLSDRVSRAFASLGVSVPSFWLGIMLVLLFAVKLGWLPAGGFVRVTESPLGWLETVALPAITLGFGVFAVFARQLRTGLVDVLNSKYVQAAWARGGTPARVVGKHALKNAAIAPITVLGLQFGALLGGTVIVEQIFSIPGIGPYMLRAITTYDMPVVQGVTLVFVLTQVTLSLVIDVVYGFLNPKIRVN